MNNKKVIIPILALTLLGGVSSGVVGLAHAESVASTATGIAQSGQNTGLLGTGVIRTVTGVNGTTLIVAPKSGTSYNVLQTLLGTVDTTHVAATAVMDGTSPTRGPPDGGQGGFGTSM